MNMRALPQPEPDVAPPDPYAVLGITPAQRSILNGAINDQKFSTTIDPSTKTEGCPNGKTFGCKKNEFVFGCYQARLKEADNKNKEKTALNGGIAQLASQLRTASSAEDRADIENAIQEKSEKLEGISCFDVVAEKGRLSKAYEVIKTDQLRRVYTVSTYLPERPHSGGDATIPAASPKTTMPR